MIAVSDAIRSRSPLHAPPPLRATMSVGQRAPLNSVTSPTTSSSSFSVTDILQPSTAAEEAGSHSRGSADDLTQATDNTLTSLQPYRTSSHAPAAHDASYAPASSMTSMGTVNGAAYNYMSPLPTHTPGAYAQYNTSSDISSHFADSMRPPAGWGYPTSAPNYPRKCNTFFHHSCLCMLCSGS